MSKTRTEKRIARKRRVRSKISGTAKRPRFAIFKSNKEVYVQLIDDTKGHTLVAFDSRKAKSKTTREKAKEVGLEIAKLATEKKIKEVVFDRAGYLYSGIVKVLADSAREGGLKF